MFLLILDLIFKATTNLRRVETPILCNLAHLAIKISHMTIFTKSVHRFRFEGKERIVQKMNKIPVCKNEVHVCTKLMIHLSQNFSLVDTYFDSLQSSLTKVKNSQNNFSTLSMTLDISLSLIRRSQRSRLTNYICLGMKRALLQLVSVRKKPYNNQGIKCC